MLRKKHRPAHKGFCFTIAVRIGFDDNRSLGTGAYQIRSVGQSQPSGDNIEVFRLNDKEGTVMDVSVNKQTFFIESGREQIIKKS